VVSVILAPRHDNDCHVHRVAKGPSLTLALLYDVHQLYEDSSTLQHD